MITSQSSLNALYHVYNGDTYDYAKEANDAFDDRTRAADALTRLLIERSDQSAATSKEKDLTYSEPWSQLAQEGNNLALANQDFDFYVSMAAGVTPSRQLLGESLLVSPADVNDLTPDYTGTPGL